MWNCRICTTRNSQGWYTVGPLPPTFLTVLLLFDYLPANPALIVPLPLSITTIGELAETNLVLS